MTTLAVTAVALLVALAIIGLDTALGWAISRYTRWRRRRVPLDPATVESITRAVEAYESQLRKWPHD